MKRNEVNIRLSELQEIECLSTISHRNIRHYDGSPVRVALNVRIEPDERDRTVTMVVGVSYITTYRLMQERLLQYTVAAVFEFDDCEGHVSVGGDSCMINTSTMVMMLGVTIGSLRGMLALRTAGTFLRNYPLPIINISELVSRLAYGSDVPFGSRPLFNHVYE